IYMSTLYYYILPYTTLFLSFKAAPSAFQLRRQFLEAIDDEIAGGIRRWIGRPTRPPLERPLDEARLEAFLARRIEVEVMAGDHRSEEHTSELQSREKLVCRL